MIPDKTWQDIEKSLMTATDEATSKIRRLRIGSAVYCRLDKRGRVRIPAGFLKRGMLKAGLIRFGWKQDILMVFPLETSALFSESLYPDFIELRLTALYDYTRLLTRNRDLLIPLFEDGRQQELADRIATLFNIETDSLSIQILDEQDPDVSAIALIRQDSHCECLWVRYDPKTNKFRISDIFDFIGVEFPFENSPHTFLKDQHCTVQPPVMADWDILEFKLPLSVSYAVPAYFHVQLCGFSQQTQLNVSFLFSS